MHGPETRPTLIGRLADPACEQAWAEFVRLYHDVIYRVARARRLQHADAEDVTQEVFSIVARKVADFDPDSCGSFRGWLRKLARDTAIDRLRRPAVDVGSGDSAVRQKLSEIAADVATATLWDAEVKREQLRLACDRIRDQFSEGTWQSFWLTAIKQQSIAEVAQQLGRSEGSVRVARCRVMAKLKTEVRRDDRENSL
ncbi:sigma-70 family RNA polymerase sigma factor [Roseiconus nitratireducens]|uniref:Sigma-70 family RNA polymerase sigma factor n=1 Tax=Roseiconus nitratireducens TaxID=2605748 RepID=A0A5M6D7R4_9BACT|nr:sigma-70 family RNA polymerase sigma factor [Roseiconus nitratireducens]KAA5542696.1 sigma-70 family RNA polymerase sigma factor [Roseiconus nitratireducens]